MKEEASKRPICPWLAAVVVSLGVVPKKKKVSNIDHSQMVNLVGASKNTILGPGLGSRVGLVGSILSS